MRNGVIAAEGTPAETITSDVIRRVFDIDAVVARTEDGAPYLLPQMMQQIAISSVVAD
jgi:iron complex transport system ATP-binding protein